MKHSTQIPQNRRKELHTQLSRRVQETSAKLDELEGSGYHDMAMVANVFDELHAVIYTVSTRKRWEQTLHTVRRILAMVSDKELRSSIEQEIQNYNL